MKRSFVGVALLAAALVLTACATPKPAAPGPATRPSGSAPRGAAVGPAPVLKVVTTGLANPWELTRGPDNFLWVTEKAAKRVTRIDPADGGKKVVLTVDEVFSSGAQDGLLGMAFGDRALYLA